MTPRIVVTDHIFGDLEIETTTAAELGAELESHQVTTEDDTVAVLSGVDLAFVNFAHITRRVLAAMAPRATIVRYGIGYDNIDIEAARDLGIRVCNVPDYGSYTVADHAVTCALMLLRKVVRYDRTIAAGGWLSPPDLAPIRSFSATTVGLLGTGRIGLAVADRLAPFGFTVIAHDPYADAGALAARGVEPVSIEQLFRRSQLLSLHAPATESTRRIVNAETLALMPDDAALVNTARGALVNHDDLLDALNSGRLSGAALDVVEPEPLPADHPLRGHPGVVLTPHAAFYSQESMRALQRLASDEILRAARGEPLRCRVA